MSTKRIKDPAGLLPDHVTIDLDDPHPDDRQAVYDVLEFVTPKEKIDRLRRHESLVEVADRLAARLAELDGIADDRLFLDISAAEFEALYRDAAPVCIEKRTRVTAQQKCSDAEIDAALRNHNGNRTLAAAELKMTPRQVRNRINERVSLRKWRKVQKGKS